MPKQTLFGYSSYPSIAEGQDYPVYFTILSPRFKNGNYPDNSTKSQVKMFEESCKKLGLTSECWATEDTHGVFVNSRYQFHQLVKELESIGWTHTRELDSGL
jgi:hypothetical protein